MGVMVIAMNILMPIPSSATFLMTCLQSIHRHWAEWASRLAILQCFKVLRLTLGQHHRTVPFASKTVPRPEALLKVSLATRPWRPNLISLGALLDRAVLVWILYRFKIRADRQATTSPID